jgi:hypothetical protein
MADPWAAFPIVEAAQQPAADPWAAFPIVERSKPGLVEDVAKGFGAGVLEGGMKMAGMPALIGQKAIQLGAEAGDYLRQKIGLPPNDPRLMAELEQPMPGTFEFNKAQVQKVADPFYQPKTVPGEYAKTTGEFAAGAPLVGGGIAAKALQTAIPAAITEFSGQTAREIAPEYEGPVRAVAAILSGGAAAIPLTRSAPKAVAASHMTQLGDDAVMAAGKLMQEAQVAGVPLTWPEAIAQTSGNAASLTTLQRFVEGSERGGEVMRGFMSKRPEQIEQAGRAALGEVATPIASASTIGPEASRAAKGVISDTKTAINAATRPAYQAAEGAVLEPQTYAALRADPLFAQTLREVRADPSLNRTIANLPDEAVGTVDLVQRRMREAGENASIPGQASTSNLRAANLESARDPAIAAAEAATGGPSGAYATARAAQTHLRAKYLQPLVDGPLGRIAKTEEGNAAIQALFPTNPLPGSAQETGAAVAALAKKSRPAAERLVRAHIESVFNEQTQKLASGANEFGGAKFAAVLTGNAEQRANLEAAIRALPDGGARWDGFNKFLTVLEATGLRQRAGSQTSSNMQMEESFRAGGKFGEALSIAGGGFLKLPERIRQSYERYRLGEGTAELARIFTDPAALPVFKALAREAADTSKAQALSARLISLGATQSSRGPSGQSN